MIWFGIGLAFTAIIVYMTRNIRIISGLMLGIFAGLLLLLAYPLMPLVGKGLVTTLLTGAPSTVENTIRGMGWVVVIFPMPIFFLAYFHSLPMRLFTLIETVFAFTVSYDTVLEIAFFRSVNIVAQLSLLIFFIVLFSMLGFCLIIRGLQHIGGKISNYT